MNFKRVYGYLTQTARQVLLLGAAWFITTNANAQKLNFAHLTVKDGLSKNYIIDITQDNFRFMWLAPDMGLTDMMAAGLLILVN